MNNYTNFFKFLIILFLLCILYKISFNFYENFNDSLEFQIKNKEVCDQKNNDPELLPNPIKLNLEVNDIKNQIKLKWKKDSPSKNIEKYIILMYKNNNGPYLIFPKNNSGDDNLIYNFEDPLLNVNYKFAVVGVNKYGKSKIDKYNEVIITFDNIEYNKVNSLKSHIVCNENGMHDVIFGDKKMCPKNINSIEALTEDKKFDHKKHEKIMEYLNKKNKINFNLKIV